MAGRPGDRPWTAAEVETIHAMRGRHTIREIAETLGRTHVAVKNKMKSARLPAKDEQTKGHKCPTLDEAFGCEICNPPRFRPAAKAAPASDGIRQRLGITATSDTPSRKSGGGATAQSEASVTLEPMLIVPDAHRPFHSHVWWDLLMQVGRYLKPKHLIVIGDFADFYEVSDHPKDPQRKHNFADELADVDQGLDELDSLGAVNKIYVEGNHEDRLRRHLMKDPALAGVVSTRKLLRLDERGWQFTPYKRHTQLGAVHYTHDVGASGRNAAFRVLDTYQHSSVTGHAHRMQYIVEGNAVGEVKLSAMFGWGGDPEKVDYMHLAKARKDWANGMGVGYIDPSSGYTYLVPVPVVDRTVCVNGRLFRSSVAA